MDVDRKALLRIKGFLKSNPRGMNVTEISREIGMNRQSVAKYMEMMVMSGHVDVRTFGPSKVYYLSQRLPISAMLSLSNDLILILDRNLSIANVNDRFLEFTGSSREDLVYRNIGKFAFPLEFEPPILPNITGALGGKETSLEALYRKDNEDIFFNIKFIPMVLDDGEKGVTIIFEDITARKHSEMELERRVKERTAELEAANRALSESQLTLSTLISNLPGMVYRCGASEEYIIEYVSDGCIELTGYSPSYFLGKPLSQYIDSLHPDDRHTSMKAKRLALEEKRPFNIKYRIVDASGSEKWMWEQGRGVFSHDGKLENIQGVILDITDSVRTEKALAASEEKYRSLVESVSDGVWELDTGFRFTYISPRIYDMTGFSQEYAIGKTPFDLMPEDEARRMRQIVGTTGKLQTPFLFIECMLQHKNGGLVPVEINGTPIFDGEGSFKGFRGVTRNVSQRRKTDNSSN